MMIKYVFQLSLWSCLALLFAACNKSHTPEPATCLSVQGDSVLSVTLTKNQPFLLSLGNFGREEYTLITTQAQHYNTSLTYRDSISNGSAVYYRYVPATNYTGPDQVAIRLFRGSAGDGYNPIVTNKVIQFTITP